MELDATKHKLNNIEKTLMNPKLTKEDIENLDDALSKHITDFQSIALTIENLLSG